MQRLCPTCISSLFSELLFYVWILLLYIVLYFAIADIKKKTPSKPTFKLQVSIKSTIYYSPPQPAADNHKDKN